MVRERKVGKLNFYLTQIITGDGVFRKFRCKIGKANDPTCWQCNEGVDDPMHTMVTCKYWNASRRKLLGILNLEDPSRHPRVIMEKAYSTQENWNALMEFINEVMAEKTKRELEEDSRTRN